MRLASYLPGSVTLSMNSGPGSTASRVNGNRRGTDPSDSEGDHPDLSAALSSTVDGTASLIRVHVSPGARGGSQLKGFDEWRKALTVTVAAPAQDGRANAELCRFLALVLDVPARTVQVIEGQKARTKRVRVEGLAADIIRAHLLESMERE